VHTTKEIHNLTKIPTSTIHDNIKKLKKTRAINYVKDNSWSKKITKSASRAIGQYIHYNSTIMTRQITTKLIVQRVEVFYIIVLKHLSSIGYLHSLLRKTLMLTNTHKQAHIEYARKHFNNDWERMFFIDETAFQLF
jgi:hypothetical protein